MTAHLERGRELHRQRAWESAWHALSLADREEPLVAADLELLALAAYLTGRDQEYLAALGRAHQGHADAGDRAQAARCAFWLGLRLAMRGETGRATGWLGRAQRMVDGEEPTSLDGYLLLPVAEGQFQSGSDDALDTSTRIAAIGERFGDRDLVACGRHLEGRVHLRDGRVAEGLAILDEVMVGAVGGELSPLVTGLIYCSVIDACQQVHALGRAREWTAALATWCDQQPEMLAFSGVCLVHRAEMRELGGDWPGAIEEARVARDRCQASSRPSAGAALYLQGEVHRQRGELAAAEEAYRHASDLGCEPQPGLALLRLAQGGGDAAAAAIRRALAAATDPLRQTRLLPAYVEIMLAAGELEDARGGSAELDALAQRFDTDALRAMAEYAGGSVDLAAGDPQAALARLRRAWEVWDQLEVPYEAARARVLVGEACRALGDEDSGRLEIDAARRTFEQLGAAPDLARTAAGSKSAAPRGLTARELEVLRLVAAGKTNKAIAAELFVSEKTVDRHVSNILGKLDVTSRTAAAAFAYEHKLV